ncbi:hypothetical protein WJX72_007685 [[Myrmecia] bisecta]|uniref:Histidine kinase/HSP90-like ATPase domain-containing protein n=1 Tax=[Myrmecia] bisecta TaxID=41462 RepID=A0AAW1PAY0_9CHLO
MARGKVLLLLLAVIAACALLGSTEEDFADHLTSDVGVSTGHKTETDPGTAAKEAAAANPAGLAAKFKAFRQNAEKFEFQAEVSRLMDIIINSLYSNKDIFLRELISNASDALDKLRLLALKDSALLGEGEEAALEIRIRVDKEKRVLQIRDRGIGMTKKDLVNNLGTIAKSGTAAFLEQMQKGGDVNLIGQFGVGFYSVYLVADYVEVITKHNDDKQYIWESDAGGNYAISEDTEGERIGRGTVINIHLKEDEAHYAEEAKLKELVAKYSEFINFPIYLYASKEVSNEVPVEDEEGEDEATETEEADSDESEEESENDEEEKPKTKTVKETVWDWEVLNDNKAIWLRDPKDVSEQEYNKFYEALAKTTGEKPLAYSHFKAEGDVEFKSVLFIPSKAPFGFLDNYYTNKPSMKLYVRRVFITDEFDELMPRYLSFLRGLVDSDTLPLSVSRETLQQHSSLKTIKKKMVRKALDMLRKLAEGDKPEESDEDAEGEEAAPADTSKYETFWTEFGKVIKLGIIEDKPNAQRLAKLVRFHTSHSPDKLTSFDEYISRMKEGQKQIYYIAGESKEALAKSPFLEQLLKKGYEVIYFTDSIDEYMMQNLPEYDDKKFQNASKEDLKLGDKDKKQKKQEKELKERFKELTERFKELTVWWKDVLGSEVEKVKVSHRLASSPCVVVTGAQGWSANMERIMRAQALSDKGSLEYMKGRKTLEINPRHPLVQELRVKYEADKESESAKAVARLLYETALLESGFQVASPQEFNSRVHGLIAETLGVSDLTVEEAPQSEADDVEEDEEVKPAADAQDSADADDKADDKDEL